MEQLLRETTLQRTSFLGVLYTRQYVVELAALPVLMRVARASSSASHNSSR